MHPSAMRVFKFICDFKTARDGNSPTSREIADGCGLKSTSHVHFYLRKLEDAGLISVWRHRSRMIYVMGGNWNAPKGPS